MWQPPLIVRRPWLMRVCVARGAPVVLPLTNLRPCQQSVANGGGQPVELLDWASRGSISRGPGGRAMTIRTARTY
eukprot:6678309-Lingulodinium_polyedra.AAC.1